MWLKDLKKQHLDVKKLKNPRETIVDFYQSGKGNKAISKALSFQQTTVGLSQNGENLNRAPERQKMSGLYPETHAQRPIGGTLIQNTPASSPLNGFSKKKGQNKGFRVA